MAITYQLIASETVSSGAPTQIEFSSIPTNFTDLLLRYSARGTGTNINIDFAYGSGSTYSYTRILGDGATPTSTRASSAGQWRLGNGINISTTTSNTFNSGELYITNYNSSENKVASVFNVAENNGTTAYINTAALLKNNTAAVTNLLIATGNGFADNSSFFLYGIKNS